MGGTTSAVNQFGKQYARLKEMNSLQATVLVLAAVGLLALFLAVMWPGHTRPDQCGSARPTIAVRLGDGVSRDSLLAKHLPAFLAYYPILALKEDVAVICDGVPQFALEVRAGHAPDRSIHADLRDLNSRKTVWSEMYDLHPTPGYEPEVIIAARIAYWLGKPMGEFERSAASVPWRNSAARMEFACLHGANSLYPGGSEEQIAKSHECLAERAMTSASADVPATFAAVDLMKNHADSGGHSGLLSQAGEQAIARARKMEPDNSVLLEMELELYRIRKPLNLARSRELLRIIEGHYAYHPQMLRTMSRFYGDMLDDYPRTIETARLAYLIAPDEPKFAWGRIWANFSARRRSDLVEDRAEIMRLDRIESALLALAMAPYGPSPQEDAKAAHEWIDQQNLSSRGALQRRIAGLAYSDKIKIELNEVVSEYYKNNDQNGNPAVADIYLESMSIP